MTQNNPEPRICGGGRQTEPDEAEAILQQISEGAHTYVKSKTKQLTALRDFVETPRSVQSGPKDETGSVPTHPSREIYELRLNPSIPDERQNVPSFAKDYARIIHSPSFRRLQGKTQLIPAGENEFFRTRLTHSIEVADIATRIARRINSICAYFRNNPIDLELVTCAALLHDIGHPPFGHSGEEVLNEKMQHFGGFEGNAQTLRIVTRLENRLGRERSIAEAIQYPRGLNLTIGTLSSVLKYDNKVIRPTEVDNKPQVTKGYYPSEEDTVRSLHEQLGLAHSQRLYSIECQIMDMADDIAYSAYDLEDTLEAGIVTPFDLMSIEDETLLKIGNDLLKGIRKRNHNVSVSPSTILKHLADVFGALLTFAQTDRPYELNSNRMDRLAFVGRTYLESVQHAKNPLVRRQYLETMIEQNIASLNVVLNESFPFLSELIIDTDRLITMEALKAFNFHKVITSRRLQLQHHRNRKILGELFDALAHDRGGSLLSDSQREALNFCNGNQDERMRLIADILSSLTDLEAINLYDQLHSTRNTRFWNYSR